MSAVVPLPIYPWPMPPQRLQTLREAKARLEVPYLIQPCPAVPGSPTRVLAYGAVPDFVCEFVLIGAGNVERPESVARALECVLSAPAEAPGVFTHAQWLGAVMGGEVTYLGEEVYEPPVLDAWGMPIRQERAPWEREPWERETSGVVFQ